MSEKEKLINLILDILEETDYSCELCHKMEYECPVKVPMDDDISYAMDFSKCNFKSRLFKTLTT